MSDLAMGGCLCGQFHYSFDKKHLLSAHHCHCTDCQKTTGCGKATILLVPTKALKTEGQLKSYTVKGTAGSHISRGFCEHCGSPVLSWAEENPDLRIIKAGSLNDSDWVHIHSSIWADSARPWSPVDVNLPSMAGNPERR